MFKHLDRDNAIESRLRIPNPHVGRFDAKILKPRGLGARLDMSALAGGIGERDDFRLREVARHPQRQRPPAAAELQNPHPIL